ncbi:MAG: alpha/beta hydrolase [Candidatus Rokuibacteriota bacterium]
MRRRVLVVSVVLGAGLAAGVGWALHQGSADGLESRKGRLLRAAATPAGADSVSDLSELELRSSTGNVVRAMVRVPRGASEPYPAVVLVGGIELGRRVAALRGLDGIARHAVIVSPDYPFQVERRSLEGWGLLAAGPRLREGAFDLVAQIGLQVDYLLSRRDVARGRVFLVGSSFGAPAVVIAGGVDARPAAVIAIYGGGNVASLVAHVLQQGEREALPAWQAAMVGRALALLLAPLEPTRYAARIAPRPVLMVNGAGDSLIPRANVMALFDAAREPKDILWMRGEHVHPDEKELIGAVSGWLAAWLARRGLLPPEAALEN